MPGIEDWVNNPLEIISTLFGEYLPRQTLTITQPRPRVTR